MDGPAPSAGAEPMFRLPQPPPHLQRFFDPSFYTRTFFCIGPVCLCSGAGLGLGVGCGAGIGKGWMPITASTSAAGGGLGGSGAFASLPLGSMLGGIPGGYFVLDLLRNVLRKFPGAQPGVGCGVGFGYGIGIGLHYGRAGAATFRRTSYSVPSSGAYRAGSEYVAPPQPAAPAPAPSPDVLRRVNELEKRLQNLEERLNTQIRLFELEQRLNRLERDTGATGKKKGH